MTLAEKIMKLRRAAGFSQEELADRLGVSRQAVSKWESGQSVPDVDKIILLSTMFGVTTDYLLKNAEAGNGGDEAGNDTVKLEEATLDSAKKHIDAPIAERYVNAKFREARLISIAVLLFILSPVALINQLFLFESTNFNITETLATSIALVILFSLVSLGVGICIYSSFLIKEFSLKGVDFTLEKSALDFLENKKSSVRKRHAASIITGTVLCLISPLPLIISSLCHQGFEQQGENVIFDYTYVAVCLTLLLVLVAVGVSLLVNAGMRDEAIESIYIENLKKEKSVSKSLTDIYWSALPFIYLAISFLSGRWEITWIIWPLSPIIPSIISLFRKNN